jgi:hypothetical protein
LLTELDPFLRVPLQRLRVVPEVTSREEFAYSIDEIEQLTLFRESAKRAYVGDPSGHNLSLFEAELILENADRQTSFLARVFEKEREDLFLERRSERHNPDGSWSFSNFRTIRLPGLGQWMMTVAPFGRNDLDGPTKPADCPKSSPHEVVASKGCTKS